MLESMAMNQPSQPHSNSWVTFTYISFFASAGMVAAGILFLPPGPMGEGLSRHGGAHADSILHNAYENAAG